MQDRRWSKRDKRLNPPLPELLLAAPPLCENNLRHKFSPVKEIALQALKDNDKISLEVFEELGFILGEALKPILVKFNAECLVLGGQISKSFDLFSEPLKERLQPVPSLKKITRAQLIDSAALYGAAKLVV